MNKILFTGHTVCRIRFYVNVNACTRNEVFRKPEYLCWCEHHSVRIWCWWDLFWQVSFHSMSFHSKITWQILCQCNDFGRFLFWNPSSVLFCSLYEWFGLLCRWRKMRWILFLTENRPYIRSDRKLTEFRAASPAFIEVWEPLRTDEKRSLWVVLSVMQLWCLPAPVGSSSGTSVRHRCPLVLHWADTCWKILWTFWVSPFPAVPCICLLTACSYEIPVTK